MSKWLKAAKLTVENTTGHFRPQRSATGPAAMAAIISPTRLAEKIYPIAFKGMCMFPEMEAP